jgi:hypothetical protein
MINREFLIQKEVREFLNKVQPCIKRTPRKYVEV